MYINEEPCIVYNELEGSFFVLPKNYGEPPIGKINIAGAIKIPIRKINFLKILKYQQSYFSVEEEDSVSTHVRHYALNVEYVALLAQLLIKEKETCMPKEKERPYIWFWPDTGRFDLEENPFILYTGREKIFLNQIHSIFLDPDIGALKGWEAELTTYNGPDAKGFKHRYIKYAEAIRLLEWMEREREKEKAREKRREQEKEKNNGQL